MRLTRHPRLPPEVRSALPLERGEKVLTGALADDGEWVVATDRALFVGGRRVPWARVAHAVWEHEARDLVVDEMPADGGEGGQLRLQLADPGFLPETVHERVMASIVLSRHVPLRGRKGVRVVARRVPGDDDLAWQALLDAGLDPADPDVRTAANEAVAGVRRELEG